MGGTRGTCLGQEQIHTKFWYGNLKERNLLEDFHIDVSVIFSHIRKKYNGLAWTGFTSVWAFMKKRMNLQVP